MVSRLTLALAALAASLCLSIAHAGDGEIRIGIGAALNNNEPYREETKDECLWRGALIDASAVWRRALAGLDAQVSWTYISCSDFGTEQAVTATLLKRIGAVQVGAGLILGYTQSYEDWQRDYVPPDPIGARECTFCGVSAQLAYEYKRTQFQLRYWRTDFNIYPGHNGALALITWRL